MTPQTEQEHLRELVDALGAAQSDAALHLGTSFRTNIRQAASHAMSLAFYRNQSHWNIMAAHLDTISKLPLLGIPWPETSQLCGEIRRKVEILARKGTH